MHKAVKNRIYFTVFSAIIIAIVGGVLVWQLQKNMVFFYTPTDIILQPKSDKNIWLGGIVKSYKMQEKKGEVLHIFVITDNKTDITIEYSVFLLSFNFVFSVLLSDGLTSLISTF